MTGKVPYAITSRLSDEAALTTAGALTALWALQQLAAPHSAHAAVWSQSVPYSEAVQRCAGLGAASMAATPLAVARLPGSRAVKKLLLRICGATWIAFGAADAYYSRAGVARNGSLTAALNLLIGGLLLVKGLQPPPADAGGKGGFGLSTEE